MARPRASARAPGAPAPISASALIRGTSAEKHLGYIMSVTAGSGASTNQCRTKRGDSADYSVITPISTEPGALMYPAQWRNLSEGPTTRKLCYVKETGKAMLFGFMVSATECGVLQVKAGGYELRHREHSSHEGVVVVGHQPRHTRR